MAPSLCASIKKALRSELTSGVNQVTRGGVCILTLPLRTIDGGFVEVMIERRIGDFVVVHDAGKTIGSLHVQGIHWTDSRKACLSTLAERFGAKVDSRGVFQIACKEASTAQAILLLSQCMTAATSEVAAHAPVVEEEPIRLQVRRAMERWKPKFLTVAGNVRIKGANEDHSFDSVAHHSDSKHKTVAVKALPFSYGARVQTDRYGYLVLDIKGTLYDKWRRLAVVSQADRWPITSLRTIRKFSADTLELRSGEEHFADQELTSLVQKLAHKKIA